MNNLKVALAAAAIVAAANAASAAIIVDDGTTVISEPGKSITYFFDTPTDGGAGDWRHTFDLARAGTGSAAVSLTPAVAKAFAGLTLAWWDLNGEGDADDVLLKETSVGAGVTELATVFGDPDTLVQQLRISWTASTGRAFDGDVTIETSAVPLPAAGLLLVGGLGAFGAFKRRKAA